MLPKWLFPLLFIPPIFTHAYLNHRHGDLCDVRGPAEVCDQSRGLTCSFETHRCACWHMRTVYSPVKGRCVGKAGEQCHFFGGERLCTENSYCLEDESLSPIPICLCLKGYFKGSNGSCIRRSRYGEFCDLSSKYSTSGSSRSMTGIGVGYPTAVTTTHTNSNCEPESGLHCINYSCQCESNQIYDPNRELCISQAGMACTKSLNNCVENAECSEKIWAFDHGSGNTKMVGHRCACKPGLKVTEDGFCAVEYGGVCNSSSECYFGEGLTCINSKCQCQPLSQVYDRRARKCLNLVGTKCQAQELKQDRMAPASNQREVGRLVMDFTSKPQPSSSSAPPTTSTTTPASTAATSTSTEITTTKNTVTSSTTSQTKPHSTVIVTTSTTTTAATTTSNIPPSSSTSTGFNIPTTTENPNSIKSRNLTARNFHFSSHHNPSGSNNFSHERQRQQRSFYFTSPRHYNHNGYHHYRHLHENSFPEHRSSSAASSSSSVDLRCVPNAECVSSTESSTSESYCRCQNGSSETILRTCLLDHGESCGQSRGGRELKSALMSSTPPPPDCNVYKGLVCQSDTGTCQCADPMLIYDADTRACLSSVGNPCGKMRLNSMLLSSSSNYQNNKEAGDSSFIPPFYPDRDEQFVYISCGDNATCVESSINGQFHQVCALKGRSSPNKFAHGL